MKSFYGDFEIFKRKTQEKLWFRLTQTTVSSQVRYDDVFGICQYGFEYLEPTLGRLLTPWLLDVIIHKVEVNIKMVSLNSANRWRPIYCLWFTDRGNLNPESWRSTSYRAKAMLPTYNHAVVCSFLSYGGQTLRFVSSNDQN